MFSVFGKRFFRELGILDRECAFIDRNCGTFAGGVRKFYDNGVWSDRFEQVAFFGSVGGQGKGRIFLNPEFFAGVADGLQRQDGRAVMLHEFVLTLVVSQW